MTRQLERPADGPTAPDFPIGSYVAVRQEVVTSRQRIERAPYLGEIVAKCGFYEDEPHILRILPDEPQGFPDGPSSAHPHFVSLQPVEGTHFGLPFVLYTGVEVVGEA